MADEFILGAYWKRRPQTLGGHTADVQRYFKELQGVDGVFSRLFYRAETLPGFQAALAPDFSNLGDLISHHGTHRPGDYNYPDTGGTPTPQSISEIGFMASFWDGKYSSKGGFEIRISAGASSERIGSAIVIEFPWEEYGGDWLDRNRLSRLLAATVKVWKPAYALVTSHAFRDAVQVDRDHVDIGWLMYFANPAITQAFPPIVRREPIADDGAILSIMEERPSPANPRHVAAAKAIRDTLQNQGLLQKEEIYRYPDLIGAGSKP